MNITKKQSQKWLAWLFIFSMIITLFSPLAAMVNAKTFEKVEFTEMVSTEIPHQMIPEWTAKLEDNKLTVEITDAMAGIDELLGNTWHTQLYVSSLYVDYATFSGTKCRVTADFSIKALQALEDGIYTVVAFVNIGESIQWKGYLYVEKKDGVPSLYSGYAKPNIDFQDMLNEKCNPDEYRNPALLDAVNAESYPEIIEKAKEVAGNGTDEKKIKNIHDWICTNVAYDYVLYHSGNNIAVNELDYAFKDKKAVCNGFAKLANVMFRAAGIPSVYIAGVADKGGNYEDANGNQINNHAWNAVYYNGGWHYIDLTWDCANAYYGEGSDKNKTGKAPAYRYFGIPAVNLGVTHYPDDRWSSVINTIEGIEVKNERTKYVKGSAKAMEYDLYYKTRYKFSNISGGGFDLDSTWTDLLYAGKAVGEVSGYDLNTLGNQTVTVDYKGFTTSYDIEVVEKAEVTGIRVVPKVTTYAYASSFDSNNEVYLLMSDDTEVLVTDEEVTYSGYDMNKVGSQTVTVSCNGFTTTYDIKVEENKEPPKQECMHLLSTVKNNKAATCLKEGYSGDRYCNVCEELIEKGKVTPATGHTWNGGSVTKNATSTGTGIKTYTCTKCKVTKTETIPARGTSASKPVTTTKPATTAKPTTTTTTTTTTDLTQVPKPDSSLLHTSGLYRVTKEGTAGGEVAYYLPTQNNTSKITIPATITKDGITYKVTSIADNAFKGNINLKSVTIGANVVKIGKSAFNGCKSLKTIVIKTSKLTAKTVGSKAFMGISKKVQIKVPKKSLKVYKKFLYKKGVDKKAKIKKG